MRVLHVTDTDLAGRRFSGYDLLDDLEAHGIHGQQAVLRKFSTNQKVIGLFEGRGDEELQARLIEVESRHSINNLLMPWGRPLADLPAFQDADVVHYHLIHNHVVSLYDVPWLFGLKPSVWTFHDPWVVTGHCVHPLDCDGWLRGCSPCPYLDRQFALRQDRAGELWNLKRRIYSDLDVDVVVASPWMLDMVKRSALTAHLERVHLIPFGVDLGGGPQRTRAESRRRLRIPDDDYVVLLRASPWEPKGLPYLIRALALRPPPRRTTLLALDRVGLLDDLRKHYRVVELGWVTDDDTYQTALSACDVFVMPSVAESFGLMAVEAMAASRPVVCFAGTSVADVTHAPECGVAVAPGDVPALRDAIDRLATNSDEAEHRGALGRKVAERLYGKTRYLDALATLYAGIVARRNVGALEGAGTSR